MERPADTLTQLMSVIRSNASGVLSAGMETVDTFTRQWSPSWIGWSERVGVEKIEQKKRWDAFYIPDQIYFWSGIFFGPKFE
jgi:hypothetical protein